MMTANYNILKDLFSNTNQWLNFAEAKNAALLATNGAVSFSLLTFLFGKEVNLGPNLNCYLFSIMILCMLSMVINFMSFIPQTKLKWLTPKNNRVESDNLYFFGHIAKYDSDTYIEALQKKQYLTSSLTSKEVDLVNQIVTNSLIAEKKYTLFRYGVWMTLSAFITPVLGFIFYIWFDPNWNN